MRLRFSPLSFLGFSAAMVAVLMSTGRAMAQSNDGEIPAILTGVFFFCALIAGLAFYVYIALALQTIAKKTGTANDWLAWIPIANLILMLNVAKKPGVVGCAFLHSAGEHRDGDYCLDGGRGCPGKA